VTSPTEPLATEQSGWSTTLRIPTLLFMGSPQGSYITQHYSIYSNGTFSVSDDHGNTFSFDVPVSATGTTASTTLAGNSTMAVQETRVMAGMATAADVKLTYSVYDQSCLPAGIRLAITGFENWGASNTGTVQLRFNNEPISVSGDRAYFGNSSGITLGFDWSDSSSLNPTFNATSSTLSWAAGNSFDIDPNTVTSVSGSGDLNTDLRNTFYATGRFWVFYDDLGTFEYASSTDGVHWSTSTIASSVLETGSIPPAAVTYNGEYVYCAYIYSSNGINSNLEFRRGTPDSNGSITWSAALQTVGTGSYANPSSPVQIAVDTGGHAWITFEDSSTAFVVMDSKTDGTWTTASGFPYDGLYPTMMGVYQNCLPSQLTSQKMVIFCGGGGSDELTANLYNSGWQTQQTFTAYSLGRNNMGVQADAVGDIVYLVGQGGDVNSMYSFSYSGTTNSFSSATNPFSAQNCEWCPPTLSEDPSTGKVYAYWSPTTTGNEIETSTLSGSSWSTPTLLLKLPSAMTYPWYYELSYSVQGELVSFMFETGSSAPYELYFSAPPVAIPTAALSGNSWSRPGLSPYESYFSQSSDYVSPGNGLVSYEAGTLDLPGRGLDFVPSLVYSEPYAFRSSGSPYLYDNYTGANVGYGWALNLPWLGTNYLHLTDGQAFPYSWNGNLFQYNGVTNFALTKNAGGTYTLNMSSGILYRFDTSKRLISITDRTGNNKISFSYGSNNYISQVTDTVGRITTFSYNSNNQLTTISEGGRTWTLGYTGNQLTSLADPISSDPVTTFQYVGTSGANAWLLGAVLWPTQGKVTYTYSSKAVGTEVSTYYATSRNVYYGSGLLSESQSISSNLINGQMVWSYSTIEDGSGTIRSYLNYTFQQTPKSVMKVNAYDGAKTLQRISETDSDTSGRTNETKIISPTGQSLASSTYSYDNWGNLIYSKDNVGQQTWYSYANTNSQNSFGSSGCSTSFYSPNVSPNIHDLEVGQCDYQNGSGSTQQQKYFEYDSNGNLLEEKVLNESVWVKTDYTYDSYGNVLKQVNADGYTTYFAYSSTYGSAYLTKQSILSGSQNVTTTYTYDSTKGFMLSENDPNGQTTSYQYDTLGRVTLLTYPAIGGTSSQTQYVYDDVHNRLETIDGDGHVTNETFDGLGRLTSVIHVNGSSSYSTQTFTYNWLNEVASNATAAGDTYTYTYDWDGSLTKVTNPDTSTVTTSYNYANNTKTVTDENGHVTVYKYDWNVRLTSVKEYNSTSTYYLTTYSYDPSGNLLSVTDAKNQQTGYQTVYQYDGLNRLTTTTFPTSPGTTETRTYDNVGNLRTLTSANGSKTSYTYVALNRLTQVTYHGSGGTVTYTYDADGNKLSMVNPSATERYSYDAMGRLTNQTQYVGGVKYQTLYSYDKASNVLSITYPDGYVLSMTYDALNRLKTVGSFATVGYTLDSMIGKITFGDGEVTTYTYNSRDWPTQILDKYGSTKEMDLNYTYDGVGNVRSINNENYKYDWLNRLNSTVGPWGTITYAYDQVGNMVREVQGSTSTVYCYGLYNRLSSYTTSSCSSPTVSYTYDANGNLVSKTGGWTYSYNYANELTKVVHSGTTVQANSYDGDGQRIQQVDSSKAYTYSYDGLSILYMKNVTGSTTTVTKSFYADGLQVAKMVGTSAYYLHEDALGNVRLEATSSVTITFSSNYVPYGSNYGVNGKEVFMYAGEPYDSVTGLYLFGARYYDPTIGRFIAEDSYGGDDDDPTTLNKYVYAGDNPERYTDPTGHFYGREFTDYNDANYVPGSTISTCDNSDCSVFTVTTTENANGYATQITSTLGSQAESPTTDVTAMTTTISVTNPSGETQYTTTSESNTVHHAPIVPTAATTSPTSPTTNQCGHIICLPQQPNVVGTLEVSTGAAEMISGTFLIFGGAATYNFPAYLQGTDDFQHGIIEFFNGAYDCAMQGGCLPIISEGP
jgi:RHS repeat-associated protein